ncbi:MAG: polyprenyl synthetase family protein, partial [Methylocystis silviterrae]
MGIVIPLDEKKDAGLDSLLELIKPDLERTNQLIIQRMGSDVTTIPEVANHLISAGGKR